MFHVLNRGVRRMALFEDAAAYRAFLRVLCEGQDRTSIRLLAYCVMPNHFHLVLWPDRDGQLVEFMQWFQMVHARRWHRYRVVDGTGALYQGRYKAFPIQEDGHFVTVCRYVERNPLRARLVARAEDWPWSSLGQRCRNCEGPRLEPWPIPQPPAWLELVNGGEAPVDLEAVRSAVAHSVPYGAPEWTEQAISRGLGRRPMRGRPPQAPSTEDSGSENIPGLFC
ncbi:MAG TPA: transposase [Vicinamibacterales bacterium]|nr:transposase [Vicinamibacterales bacterium]